jgi:hypothetical protein
MPDVGMIKVNFNTSGNLKELARASHSSQVFFLRHSNVSLFRLLSYRNITR